MKVVFTVIALSLCVIAIQNTELIKEAEAYGAQDVKVKNSDDIARDIARAIARKTLNVSSGGSTLDVNVRNAYDMDCECR
tara:strand:+ start:240 stop:479 length:240 start_codon:yes stop_codon:yes gene_type:complete